MRGTKSFFGTLLVLQIVALNFRKGLVGRIIIVKFMQPSVANGCKYVNYINY